jgi:hypothetical protein
MECPPVAHKSGNIHLALQASGDSTCKRFKVSTQEATHDAWFKASYMRTLAAKMFSSTHVATLQHYQ